MADFRNDAEVLFSYVYDKYNRAIKEGRGFDCKSFNYALRGLAKYAIRNGDYKKAKEVLTVLWNEYQDNQMDVSEVMNLATKIGDYKLAAIAFIRFTRFYSDPEKRYNLLDFYIPEVTRLPLNRTEAIKFRRMIDSQKPAQKVLEYFDRYVLNRPS
jgi:hypothetical protein